MSANPACLLREILGNELPDNYIARLLQQSGNVLDDAVTLHFSGVVPRDAAGNRSAGAGVDMLRSLGVPGSDVQLKRLLHEAGNDVQRAADGFFSQQQDVPDSSAGPSSGRIQGGVPNVRGSVGSGGSGSAAAPQHQHHTDEEAIVISDSDDDDNNGPPAAAQAPAPTSATAAAPAARPQPVQRQQPPARASPARQRQRQPAGLPPRPPSAPAVAQGSPLQSAGGRAARSPSARTAARAAAANGHAAPAGASRGGRATQLARMPASNPRRRAAAPEPPTTSESDSNSDSDSTSSSDADDEVVGRLVQLGALPLRGHVAQGANTFPSDDLPSEEDLIPAGNASNNSNSDSEVVIKGRKLIDHRRVFEAFQGTNFRVDYYISGCFNEFETPEHRLLDTSTLCTAKARQPAVYPPGLTLARMPLKEFRNKKTWRLFCDDAEKVPTTAVPPAPGTIPAANDASGRRPLGRVKLPVLPAPGTHLLYQGYSQYLTQTQQWWGHAEGQDRFAGLEILRTGLSDGSINVSDLQFVALQDDSVWYPPTRDGPGWTTHSMMGAGIALVSTSPCFKNVKPSWTSAKLPFLPLKDLQNIVAQDGEQAEEKKLQAMVFAVFPGEHVPFTRSLALISNTLIGKDTRRDAPQANILDVSIAGITIGIDDTPLQDVAPLHSYNKTAGNGGTGTDNAPSDDAADPTANGNADNTSAAGDADDQAAGSNGAATQDTAVNGSSRQCGMKRGRESQDPTSPTKKQKTNDGKPAVVQEGTPEKKHVTGAVYVTLDVNVYEDELLTYLESGYMARAVGKSGRSKADAAVKSFSDAFAFVVHTLLARGSGLWLGPDCDGLLNFCDDDVPSKSKPKDKYHTVLPRYVDHGDDGDAAATTPPSKQTPAANGKAAKAGNGGKAAGSKAAGKKPGSRDSSAEAAAPSRQGTSSQPDSQPQAGLAGGVAGVVSSPAAAAGPGSSSGHHVDLEQCIAGLTLAEHLQSLAAERERLHKLLLEAKQKEKHAEQQLESYKRKHVLIVNDRRESEWSMLQSAKHAHNAEVILMQCHGFNYAIQHACLLFERCVQLLADAGLAAPIPESRSLLYEPPRTHAQAQQPQAAPAPSQPAQSASMIQTRADAGASAPSSSQQQQRQQEPQAPVKKLTAPADYNAYAPLALILATEIVSRKQILRRDSQGFIIMQGVDRVRGAVCGREVLPHQAFGVHALLDSLTMPPDYPMAKAPEQMKTVPKAFQLQGLAWMLSRERRGDALGRGLLQLDPEYLQLVNQQGWTFYMTRQAPYMVSLNFVPAKVETTCGGFLCDEMGLGKTLESLMLVVSNPPPPEWPVTGPMHPLVSDKYKAAPIKTTLLVVPSNLVGQWQDEIESHVKPGVMKWGQYVDGNIYADPSNKPISLSRQASAGSDMEAAALAGAQAQQAHQEQGRTGRSTRQRRAPSALTDDPVRPAVVPYERTRKYEPFVACKLMKTDMLVSISDLDMVIISYEQLRKELSNRKSPLVRYGFWRIMLDEAQLVANTNSVAAEMASSLWRRHAWVVTGTPISSKLSEVAGLCEFLDAAPFYKPVWWRQVLMMPYQSHTRAGLLSMRALLQRLMLRRTKESVGPQLQLPPCTTEDREVHLSRVERAFYEQLLREFRDAMTAYKAAIRAAANAHGMDRKRQTVPARVMTALNNLRQSCCHPHIVKRQQSAIAHRNDRSSMRQIMGRLVLQANAQLDSATAQYVTACLVQAAAHSLSALYGNAGSAVADVPAARALLKKMLFVLQSYLQHAGLADIRLAASMRNREGLPVPDVPVIESLTQKESDMLGIACAVVQATGPPLRGIDLSDIPQDWALASQRPDPQAEAEMNLFWQLPGQEQETIMLRLRQEKEAEAEKKNQEINWDEVELEPPFVVAVAAVREARPYGKLAEAACEAKNVAVVLKAVGQASAVPQNDQDLLRVAAEAELKQEVKTTADSRRDRRTRWLKLQCDLLTLQAYILRKVYPDCVKLAREAEHGAPNCNNPNSNNQARAQPATHTAAVVAAVNGNGASVAAAADAASQVAAAAPAGGQGPNQPSLNRGNNSGDMDVDTPRDSPGAAAAAYPTATGHTGVADMDIDHNNTAAAQGGAGPAGNALGQSSAAGVASGSAQAPLWGAGRDPETVQAAMEFLAARHKLNALRVQLKLEPVLDVDNAELRRSRRPVSLSHLPDDRDGSATARSPARASGSRRVGSAFVTGDASDDEDDDDDDDDFVDSEEDKRGRRNNHKSPGRAVRKAAVKKSLVPATALDLFLRGEPIVRKLEAVLAHREPLRAAALDVDNCKKAVQKCYHELTHKLNQEQEALVAMAAGQAAAVPGQEDGNAAGDGDAGGSAGEADAAAPGAGVQQVGGVELEAGQCPICLDVPERPAVTRCGHNFCAECIQDLITHAAGGGRAPCPICRTPLTRIDFFETMSAAEEVAAAAAHARQLIRSSDDEYGAKTAELLREIRVMSAKDPDAKCLVMSSWGRLLKLVQEALWHNRVGHANFMAAGQATRDKALHEFHTDPRCKVLLVLMSTSGGAAGLTLTRATTVFIMEPPVNPGLQAQAAARIHRLGQNKPTRVIRLIAAETVESTVLRMQEAKLQSQRQKQKMLPGSQLSRANSDSMNGNASGGAGNAAGNGNGEGDDDADANVEVHTAAQDLDSGTLVRFFGNL